MGMRMDTIYPKTLLIYPKTLHNQPRIWVFWYMGLVPDFAMIRDRAIKPITKRIYSILSFGWSGRVKHWQRHEVMSLVLAGLAAPLVLSVHSIVSMDFATSVIPGWHTTIFPPYFVAGAIFSGFAMVQTLLLVMRKVLNQRGDVTLSTHCNYALERFVFWCFGFTATCALRTVILLASLVVL